MNSFRFALFSVVVPTVNWVGFNKLGNTYDFSSSVVVSGIFDIINNADTPPIMGVKVLNDFVNAFNAPSP